ncbi:N-formylglutamate deformylase [hydrothermal vent metagenome]|jgi:N-formylglutamate amidohydrolase|uniref:N-formylglutamate deformylase n=3 Tax=root TaxID=1 RepID=A0A160TZ02_9ZZZZ|tara:strand:- start:60613 stop:61542 length:930 start_codon:yes stop_codon:yes gene_type:complete
MTDAPQFLDRPEHFQRTAGSQDSPAATPRYETPYRLVTPEKMLAPVIFASPHSGSLYPHEMREALCVPVDTVRRTEDAFVDELFSAVPEQGGILVAAKYARTVADLNRDPRELDPNMFSDGVPRPCGMPTARVEAGLGCLPRVAARGEAIYARRLTRSEGEARLSGIHDIYHQCLATELGSLKERHGRAFLIDCHSMPSVQPGRRNLADIVLGDRFGSSCDPRLTGRIERAFRANGFSVARNAPYAGGYTTRRYGRPKRDFHAVQIEINRGLYMDEQAVETSAGFAQMQQVLSAIVVEILDVATQIGRR